MTDKDLRKRAIWLEGVANHMRSPHASNLLRGYASELAREAERMEARSRLGIYEDPRTGR